MSGHGFLAMDSWSKKERRKEKEAVSWLRPGPTANIRSGRPRPASKHLVFSNAASWSQEQLPPAAFYPGARICWSGLRQPDLRPLATCDPKLVLPGGHRAPTSRSNLGTREEVNNGGLRQRAWVLCSGKRWCLVVRWLSQRMTRFGSLGVEVAELIYFILKKTSWGA